MIKIVDLDYLNTQEVNAIQGGLRASGQAFSFVTASGNVFGSVFSNSVVFTGAGGFKI